MPSSPDPAADPRSAEERIQLESSLDGYRERLPAALDGLDEEQARRQLVPSRTTLLGLVKHLTFVENVWFHEAITGTPRAALGPATPDDSFVLSDDDTIRSIRETHLVTCAASRDRVAELSLDHVLTDLRGWPCRCGSSICSACASTPSTWVTPTSCGSRSPRPDASSRRTMRTSPYEGSCPRTRFDRRSPVGPLAQPPTG